MDHINLHIKSDKRKIENALKTEIHPDSNLAQKMRKKYRDLEKKETTSKKSD